MALSRRLENLDSKALKALHGRAVLRTEPAQFEGLFRETLRTKALQILNIRSLLLSPCRENVTRWESLRNSEQVVIHLLSLSDAHR